MESTDERLARLRRWMENSGISGVVIPSSDPHQSEYPTAHHRVRAWISGFPGSAGTVVVTQDHAGLWTDSRYFLAAAEAIRDTDFTLHRLHTAGVLDYPAWLAEQIPVNATVAVDYRTITMSAFRRLERVGTARPFLLTDLGDVIDDLWTDRPDLPCTGLTVLSDRITGEGAGAKLDHLRAEMARHGANSHVVGTLDDIAWILNLRGNDVDYNPVFLSYLIVTDQDSHLYTQTERITPEIATYLEDIGVGVVPYDSFSVALPGIKGPVLLDPDRTSAAIAAACASLQVVEATQPSTPMKARKNAVELQNLREAMRDDGRAMVRFLNRLDADVARDRPLDELSAVQMLRDERRKNPRYTGDSFEYISGFNGNGAIVHYAVTSENNAAITAPGVYLIDSGAQYTNGTTDITRTIAIGAVPETVRKDFTAVLKGHIALSALTFPENTSGRDIDAIARVPLWSLRLNYGHGTGHGVGYILNVHEGPQRIAPAAPDWPLEVGMVVSNEPGVYRPGQWGIRIENLLAVRKSEENDFGVFLDFETLSLCPIDTRMIEVSMLTESERRWLNDYHARVRRELTPELDAGDAAWLESATAPI